jgi:hypothetical protein
MVPSRQNCFPRRGEEWLPGSRIAFINMGFRVLFVLTTVGELRYSAVISFNPGLSRF